MLGSKDLFDLNSIYEKGETMGYKVRCYGPEKKGGEGSKTDRRG